MAQLSYSEVERDIDAIVRVEGSGEAQQLTYLREAPQSPWYSRWVLMWPFKPVLVLLAGDSVMVELANPSGQVRDLAQQLAPKAGASLVRASATAVRLARIAELDPSALNRIVALNGLWRLAQVHELDIVTGLERGELTVDEAAFAAWRQQLDALRPAARNPIGGDLDAAATAQYAAAIAAVAARPLPSWQARLALVSFFGSALQDERADELIEPTRAALRLSLQHLVQWTVVRSLQGQQTAWVDVRMRALEILRTAGGPDSVPLLLALMAAAPDAVARGSEKQFDPHEAMQLRLIHLCGQLDRVRALTKVRLPGRETWEAVAPIDFLARIALDETFLSPLQLPALEAMALCLRRPHLGLDSEQDGGGVDWVRKWYDEYRRS